ncbi:hypothetical protein EZS27_021229 [termite gut metagenome]|uniref:Type-2 restriction enzyme HpaII n=1 Tax=termite gut metagenome TaxID=433724 RepID=A0A5J4R8V6_9ZZZZ
MVTGNKGEWSEIYALFKLLGDKQIFAGDANLNKIETLFYPIIKILRTESSGEFEYSVDKDIVIIAENKKELLRIDACEFSKQAASLLSEIKQSTGSAFSILETEKFMQSVKCQTLKAKSQDKADIRIVIHDLKTSIKSLLRFSIKSQLGSASTLLNAGATTNIIYSIDNVVLDKKDITDINSIETGSKIKDRIVRIRKIKGDLQYSDFENSIFRNNLELIDSLLPQIIAEIVKIYYSSDLNTIKDIVAQLEKNNPLGFDMRHSHKFYGYKIKRFLTDVALGMVPATVWTGIYDATGGYLVVKDDGEVLCYHIYNRNEFENHLFANTKLETSSTSKHHFGEIETVGEKQIFKLNLQIRFIK